MLNGVIRQIRDTIRDKITIFSVLKRYEIDKRYAAGAAGAAGAAAGAARAARAARAAQSGVGRRAVPLAPRNL